MPPELLAAMEQAEQSEPSVRTAALLRIARVLAKADQGEAECLLDRGLALLAALPEEERAAIAPQAKCLAACVAPDRAFALRGTTSDPVGNEKFLFDMVRHGHAAAAAEHLTQWSGDGEFPYHAAFETISYAKDNDTRRDIFRSGLRAWHRRRADSTWHSFDVLLQLFRFHWRLLPGDEARDAVRSLVGIIRERPDERLNGGFNGPHGTVTFSSYRPSLLFALLGPLKRLDSELANAVIAENRELRRGAEIYPFGHDIDVDRPVEQQSAEALEQWKSDWTGFALGSQFFRIEDEKNGDFKNSFEHALRSYAQDRARPNPYPRECWPSAEEFRVILYAAGRYDGASGARLLDRIPDVVLRLFAEIEFAAGIAGLEQIGSITREQL
jgi:hypothetical protein